MDHSEHRHGVVEQRMCSMHMLFTWDTQDLCVVFRWWHIRSNMALILSLLAVAGIAAGYEALRSSSRRYERWVTRRQEDLPNNTETTPFLWSGRNQVEVSKKAHITKAILYALQTVYAFMLMLVFMTYNGWVMLAVTVGAFAGYVLFGGETSATKDSACH